MSGLNGKTGSVIPFAGGAGIVGGGSFTAQFVQAPAITCALIIKSFGKFSLVVEGATITTVMDTVAVE